MNISVKPSFIVPASLLGYDECRVCPEVETFVHRCAEASELPTGGWHREKREPRVEVAGRHWTS